ncbi:DNA methyltransferase [Ruminococcus flavefaciens]|nr:DNA methyltransferase [Ruminococcus flavefaciens]
MMNPETRRAGGLHYTSIENIHKVIDPLFLDELTNELNDILKTAYKKTRNEKLFAFKAKLASFKFLDPACGSGNFLTESYCALRDLENRAISNLVEEGQSFLGDMIDVSLDQFYEIEINDFAVAVAKTALWIAEIQKKKETEEIIGKPLKTLPLNDYEHIREGNALRVDWESIVPKDTLSYIMGNPPFIGSARLSDEQKDDRDFIFEGKGGELDYVACWYKKAVDFIGCRDIMSKSH